MERLEIRQTFHRAGSMRIGRLALRIIPGLQLTVAIETIGFD